MGKSPDVFEVYLEIGQKRVFAAAVDWPGWCRSGRDESSALQALFDYGPRYARVLQAAQLSFSAPADPSVFTVVERLPGDATTDFGAPSGSPSQDALPVDDAELRRLQALLQAFWLAFDAIVSSAVGQALRKGPRGGGREVDQIVRHVLEADSAYLSRLGWNLKLNEADDIRERIEQTRQAILDGLASAAHGEIEASGPRGGLRWTPRYFVRRVAWHVLDHAWEIEDRII
jgi:hypothetical protein